MNAVRAIPNLPPDLVTKKMAAKIFFCIHPCTQSVWFCGRHSIGTGSHVQGWLGLGGIVHGISWPHIVLTNWLCTISRMGKGRRHGAVQWCQLIYFMNPLKWRSGSTCAKNRQIKQNNAQRKRTQMPATPAIPHLPKNPGRLLSAQFGPGAGALVL